MARKRLERQAQKDLEKVKSIRIKPNIKNAKGKTANRSRWAQLMSFMLSSSVKERKRNIGEREKSKREKMERK